MSDPTKPPGWSKDPVTFFGTGSMLVFAEARATILVAQYGLSGPEALAIAIREIIVPPARMLLQHRHSSLGLAYYDNFLAGGPNQMCPISKVFADVPSVKAKAYREVKKELPPGGGQAGGQVAIQQPDYYPDTNYVNAIGAFVINWGTYGDEPHQSVIFTLSDRYDWDPQDDRPNKPFHQAMALLVGRREIGIIEPPSVPKAVIQYQGNPVNNFYIYGGCLAVPTKEIRAFKGEPTPRPGPPPPPPVSTPPPHFGRRRG